MLDYCRRSANPVGRLVLQIAGYEDPSLDVKVGRRLHGTAGDQLLAGPPDRLAPRPVVRPPRVLAAARVPARPISTPRSSLLNGVTRFGRSREERDCCSRPGGACATASTGRLRFELRATWLGGMRILDRLERAQFDVVRSPSVPRRDGRGRDSLARRSGGVDAAVARDTSFYYSFLVLPPAKRRAIIAVWDFCRAVDDAVDEAAGTTDGQAGRELARWRSELARCFEGEVPETPQGRALQPLIDRFNASTVSLRGLDRRRRDGSDSPRYATFAELYEDLHPRRLCRRPHVRRDLRLPQPDDPAGTRLSSEWRCS